MGHGEFDAALERAGELRFTAAALDLAHDLRKGEHPDQHRKEVDAAFHEVDAERQPFLAHHRVAAEHGDDQTEAAGDQPLQQGCLGQPRNHRHGENEQRKELPRPELKRDCRERCGGADQKHAAEETAEERRPDAEPYCAARLALLRHRMAVEDGGPCRGSSPKVKGSTTMMVMVIVTPGSAPPTTPASVPKNSGSRYFTCAMLTSPAASSSYIG